MPSSLLERRVTQQLTEREWEPRVKTATLPSEAMLSGSESDASALYSRPTWLVPTRQALGSLLDLPTNWDSYGAPRVEPACLDSADEVLRYVMLHDSPGPSVVPTSGGGVQLEWHAVAGRVEVGHLGAG